MGRIRRRNMIATGMVIWLTLGLVAIEAKQVRADVVKGRIRNSTGQQITVGVFGKNGAEQFRATLSPGKIVKHGLYTGKRAVVVWDDFTDDVLYSEVVDISPSQKKLDLQPAEVIPSRGEPRPARIIFDDTAPD